MEQDKLKKTDNKAQDDKYNYHLIHKKDTDKRILDEADACIDDILSSKASARCNDYPTLVCNHSGERFLPFQIVERYLNNRFEPTSDYDEAYIFFESLRRLAGWREIGYQLDKFIESKVFERYFDIQRDSRGHFSSDSPCTLKSDVTLDEEDEHRLKLACYSAVCHSSYGASYESVTTQLYFSLVSQLRPDMVKALKQDGTGKLPKDIRAFKTELMSAKANDAFATIRIQAKEDSAQCYEQVLDYLCQVLEQEDFPDSYALEFRGPNKSYLPIPGLPKKGVNQLFACAVAFESLHPKIERYANLAMKEDEFYNNLSDEQCAMPGSFAIFALGLADFKYTPLVRKYLKLCDDEHSSLQAKFIIAYMRKYGFTKQTMGVFIDGVMSMQNFEGAKDFSKLIANEESLTALIDLKDHLGDYLDAKDAKDESFVQYVQDGLMYALFGKQKNNTKKLIESAPEPLRKLYERLLQSS